MRITALFQRLVSQRLASSFLFSIFCFLFSIFALTPIASAQTNIPSQEQNSHLTSNVEENVPKNLNTWTQTVMIEVMSALSCQLSGINPANVNQACLGVNPQNGKIGFVTQSPAPNGAGGAIGVMSHFISSLYNIPIHTGDYVGYLASNFGIVKPAYAQSQGTGFDGLKPLIGIWTAFRNIVYLIFTIVFVVIGFAIMFRIKIDPRTVMTIQNQIPKIIVGILLVTFSYAIAGFLIDMMYTSIYLTGNILTSASGQSPAVVNELVQSENPFNAAGKIYSGGIFGITHSVSSSVKDVIQNILGIKACESIGSCAVNIFNPLKIAWDIFDPSQSGSVANWFIDIVSYAVGTTAFFRLAYMELGTFTTPVIGDILNTFISTGKLTVASTAGISAFSGTEFTLRIALPYIIAYLVIIIAMIWALFRLWFVLIFAYIYILIDVVLAPFWIAGGLIPGSPVNFTGWLRHILSYIIVFPLTIAIFLLGKIFIVAFGTDQIAFVPPLIGNQADTNAIGAIIGLGVILMTPNVLKMAQAALKAPKVDVGSAMQAIGVGAGAINLPGHAQKVGMSMYGFSQLNREGAGKLPFIGGFFKKGEQT